MSERTSGETNCTHTLVSDLPKMVKRCSDKSCSAEEFLVANIYFMLPQEDCGECEYETCYEAAKAIAKGEAEADVCKIGGKEIAPIINCMKKLEVMCDEVSGFRTVETPSTLGKTGLEIR